MAAIDCSSRLIAAAAGWLTARRIKIYTRSLPLAALATALSTFFDPAARSLLHDGDFILFYTGGRFFLAGRLSELYNFAAQQTFQMATLKLTADQFTPFNHPPHTVLLYAPFAMAGFEIGLMLWTLAGLAALALAWNILRRELAPLANHSTLALVLLSFCFYPTIAWLLANQNSALSLLLLTLFYVYLRRGGDFIAGVALGCLLYKPQLMIVPGFLLVLNGRWRGLTACLLTSVLWVAVGLLLSPNATSDYLRVIPQIAQLPFLPSYPIAKLHNLYGFCILLFSGFLPIAVVKLVAVLLTVTGLAAVVFCWRSSSWQPATRSWDLRMAATLALGLVISPHLMFYDLTILLLPLAIVWSYYAQGTNGRALDGDRLLVWYALVYVAVFVGSYLSITMLQVGPAFGWPRFAVQISVPIVIGWAMVVRRMAVDGR